MHFRTAAVSAGGGALALGTMGGASGLALGIVAGGMAGVVPAVLTFGLSIPVGAAVGGAVGLATGSATGASAGGVAGLAAYKYRAELEHGVGYVKSTALDSVHALRTQGTHVTEAARDHVVAVADLAQTEAHRALELVGGAAAKGLHLATGTQASATSTCAGAGLVAGSTVGGTVGTVAGAAVGVVPAIFTFGLSIPVGAAIGLCLGASCGGGAGALGGGAIGYTGFAHREQIAQGVQAVRSKINASAETIKAKAFDTASHMTESVKSLVGASTGGTA